MSKKSWLAIPLLIAILLSSAFGYACTTETAENGGSTSTPKPASFNVSNLTVTPAMVETGETATVTVEVKNTGEASGTKTVTLKIDGVEVQTKDVTLSGGGTKTVSFSVVKSTAGTYSVGVEGLTKTLVVEAPAPALEILSHSSYLDTIGYYHIVGEVENSSSDNLDFVKLTATLYNAAETVVGTSFTYTTIDTLLPGQKSPFEIVLLDKTASAQVDHYTVAVSDSDITGVEPYRNFTILSHSSSTDILGYYHVVGEVKNTGMQAVTYVMVVGTFYDASGEVIATGFTYTDPSDLAAGQVAPFELIVLDETLSAGIASYELQVQC